VAKYTECESCGNTEDGATIYQCKACGRVGCSNCANPETDDGEWDLGTCFCGADKDDYANGRLFSVLGHITSDDDDSDEEESDDEDDSEGVEDED
jgi:hypothetical protein